MRKYRGGSRDLQQDAFLLYFGVSGGKRSFLINFKIPTSRKRDHIFLILKILTTDPVFRFHDEEYSITKLKRCNKNGVTYTFRLMLDSHLQYENNRWAQRNTIRWIDNHVIPINVIRRTKWGRKSFILFFIPLSLRLLFLVVSMKQEDSHFLAVNWAWQSLGVVIIGRDLKSLPPSLPLLVSALSG